MYRAKKFDLIDIQGDWNKMKRRSSDAIKVVDSSISRFRKANPHAYACVLVISPEAWHALVAAEFKFSPMVILDTKMKGMSCICHA